MPGSAWPWTEHAEERILRLVHLAIESGPARDAAYRGRVERVFHFERYVLCTVCGLSLLPLNLAGEYQLLQFGQEGARISALAVEQGLLSGSEGLGGCLVTFVLLPPSFVGPVLRQAARSR